MHKLIKNIKVFGARILETEFCKGLIKSFSSEDAEYLNQIHQRKSSHRVYDELEIEIQKHQNDPNSANFIAPAPNNRAASKQASTHRDSCVNPEIHNTIDTAGIHVFSIDDRTSIMHNGLDELLSSSDVFTNDEPVLPQITLPDFLVEPNAEGFPVTPDEDEWLTPDIADAANEEDIWEGRLPPSVAIESLPTKQELSGLPDRLTRAERALQIALKIGEEFDWDRNGIQLLATIFNRYWWSSSQMAMRRAIESGMTQKELILAEELRQMWYERPEFWSALNKFGEICHLYSLISWPTALKIIRSFNSYPQIEEVEALLNQCLERWINSISLQHSFRGFYMYALYRVGANDDLADHDGWIIFDDYQADENEFVTDLEQTRELHHLGIYIDPQAERYPTNSWDGQLVLLNARHGHESYEEEGSLSNEPEDRKD